MTRTMRDAANRVSDIAADREEVAEAGRKVQHLDHLPRGWERGPAKVGGQDTFTRGPWFVRHVHGGWGAFRDGGMLHWSPFPRAVIEWCAAQDHADRKKDVYARDERLDAVDFKETNDRADEEVCEEGPAALGYDWRAGKITGVVGIQTTAAPPYSISIETAVGGWIAAKNGRQRVFTNRTVLLDWLVQEV